MDNYEHNRIVEALELQTQEVRSIRELIVRIVYWSAIVGLMFSVFSLIVA